MQIYFPAWIKMVFERRNWFESARKYFVIGQKSVLKNDGLFVFLLLLRAFPLWGKYFCRNRSRVGAKLQILSDFPDLSCFSRPRARTCKILLSKARNQAKNLKKSNYNDKIMIFLPAPAQEHAFLRRWIYKGLKDSSWDDKGSVKMVLP